MASPDVFERVSRGGRWVVAGRLLGIALTVAINAYLARVLGPAGFGGYILAMTLMGFLSLVGMVGLNEALVRFISEALAHHRPHTAARTVLRGFGICVAAFLLVGPVGFVVICYTPLGLDAVGSVPHIALLVVLGAAALGLQQLASEALRGFHHLKLASLFAGGQTGGLLCTGILLSVIIVASTEFQLSLSATLTLVLLSLLATLPFTYFALWRTARAAQCAAVGDADETDGPAISVLIPVGGTIMITHALAFITLQADLWIAGVYCPYDDVGLYGSARRLTLLAAMPVQIAILTTISSIADLHVRGKRAQLQAMLRGAASLAAVPALAATIIIFLAPTQVLTLVFGEAYQAARVPTLILAAGLVPLILCGNPVHTLTMTGHHRSAMFVNLATTLMLIVLGPWAAQSYGVVGLAWVSAASLGLQNIALWILARAKAGVWTHVGSLRPPIRTWRRRNGAKSPSPAPDGVRTIFNQTPSLAPATANSEVDSRTTSIWWLQPEILFAIVVGGTMTMALWLSPDAYLQYGAPKYLNWTHCVMAAAAILVFTIGAWIARLQRTHTRATPQTLLPSLSRWFIAAALLTLVGYAVWGASALKGGLSLDSIRRFSSLADPEFADQLKQTAFRTIPGVTTATQFGIAAFLLGTWLWAKGSKWVMYVLLFLMAATMMRAILNSERLALLEVLVPALLIVLKVKALDAPISPRTGKLLRLAPLIAVVGLLLVFGGTEYFRSWRYYRQEFDSLAEFTVWRASGYYVTALNNGVMAWEERGVWPLPYDTLHAFWNFPLVANSTFSYEQLTGVDPPAVHMATLSQFATVELNNGSGLFPPALDYGVAGFVLYWLAFGWLAGKLYRGFMAGSLPGMTLYPLVFLSILEVPRISYLPTSRALPALVFLIALILAHRWALASVPQTRSRHSALSPSAAQGG